MSDETLAPGADVGEAKEAPYSQARLEEIDRQTDRTIAKLEVENQISTLYPSELPPEEVTSAEPAPAPVETSVQTDPPAVADGLTGAEIRERDVILAADLQIRQAEAEFQRRFGSLDLGAIERQDRSRAAQLRVEMSHGLQELAAAKARVAAAGNSFNAKLVERHRVALHASERAKMLAAVPQLHSPSVTKEFNDFLARKYTPAEVNRTLDSRFFVAEFHAFQASKPKKKTVIPKRFTVKRPTVTPRSEPTFTSPGVQFANEFYGQQPAPKRVLPAAARRSGFAGAIEILYDEVKK
jgi:hypothetical protein